MDKSSLVGIGLLVLGISSYGCLDPSSKPDFYDPDRPLYSTQSIISVGSGGIGGINGMLRSDLTGNDFRVVEAASSALWDPQSPGQASAGLLITGLFNTDSARNVLHYAMRCALASEDGVTGGEVPKRYAGGGILAGTGSWTTSSIDAVQTSAVLTCLIAHANYRGDNVPIVLNGPLIQGDGVDHSDSDMIEAVWLAKLESDSAAPNGIRVRYNVWPRDDLAAYCGVDAGDTIVNRTCGNLSPEDCQIVHRTDFSTACTGSDGVYECDGLPAIQTSLRASDLDLIYPGCML